MVTPQNRYKFRHYDRLEITVPKGAKDALKAHAAEAGESINSYVLRAVEDRSGLKLTLDGEFPAKRAKT